MTFQHTTVPAPGKSSSSVSFPLYRITIFVLKWFWGFGWVTCNVSWAEYCSYQLECQRSMQLKIGNLISFIAIASLVPPAWLGNRKWGTHDMTGPALCKSHPLLMMSGIASQQMYQLKRDRVTDMGAFLSWVRVCVFRVRSRVSIGICLSVVVGGSRRRRRVSIVRNFVMKSY